MTNLRNASVSKETGTSEQTLTSKMRHYAHPHEPGFRWCGSEGRGAPYWGFSSVECLVCESLWADWLRAGLSLSDAWHWTRL
jgi:hypothetical protein